MEDTIEDMNLEIEQNNNKIEFLEIRIGLPVFTLSKKWIN